MAASQKGQIALPRSYGISYSRIASTHGLSENTVKSYFRRNNVVVCVEDKQNAAFQYHTSMAVFRRRKNKGMINDDDLYRLALMMAKKYGLPLDSIYVDTLTKKMVKNTGQVQ